MLEFQPQTIRRVVFDLNSLGTFAGEEWSNFQLFIKVLDDRAYTTVLIGKNCRIQDWQNFSDVSVLVGDTKNILEQNQSLSESGVFWITDSSTVQQILAGLGQAFAGGKEDTQKNGGFKYQDLYDLIEIFHPSRNTVMELCDTILELKKKSPRMPLTLGIGGPDGCGHSFFVGEMLEVLQDRNQLVAGLDLTEQLGLEFSRKQAPQTFWRSNWIREWVLERVMDTFSRGEEVVVEKVPEAISAYEVTTFPFYLAPEMVLLVWGSTLFLPEFRNLIDIRILLDLSDKAATARAFNIDERENFDPAFIESYLKSEGAGYTKYLSHCDVKAEADFCIDFNNFHAFRLKAGFGA